VYATFFFPSLLGPCPGMNGFIVFIGSFLNS
jgi:hypothetical protein